jgi:hypothetical protein
VRTVAMLGMKAIVIIKLLIPGAAVEVVDAWELLAFAVDIGAWSEGLPFCVTELMAHLYPDKFE